MTAEPMVRLERFEKRYGKLQAVWPLDLDDRPGGVLRPARPQRGRQDQRPAGPRGAARPERGAGPGRGRRRRPLARRGQGAPVLRAPAGEPAGNADRAGDPDPLRPAQESAPGPRRRRCSRSSAWSRARTGGSAEFSGGMLQRLGLAVGLPAGRGAPRARRADGEPRPAGHPASSTSCSARAEGEWHHHRLLLPPAAQRHGAGRPRRGPGGGAGWWSPRRSRSSTRR